MTGKNAKSGRRTENDVPNTSQGQGEANNTLQESTQQDAIKGTGQIAQENQSA